MLADRRRPLIELVRRHRALLDRSIRVGASVAVMMVVLVAIVLRRGDWPAQRFLLVYLAPMLAYGAVWAMHRLVRADRDAPVALAIDALAFVAGALRAGGGWGVLPYSGHMLFLTYAVASPGSRPLRLVAFGLIAMTSYFKLVLWHDVWTWSLGLAAGLALAGLRAILTRRASVSVPARQTATES